MLHACVGMGCDPPQSILGARRETLAPSIAVPTLHSGSVSHDWSMQLDCRGLISSARQALRGGCGLRRERLREMMTHSQLVESHATYALRALAHTVNGFAV